MQVRVKVFATLTRYIEGMRAGTPMDIEVPDGATLVDAVTQLQLPQAEVRTVFVNGRAQSLAYALRPGDEVGIFPPVGGG